MSSSAENGQLMFRISDEVRNLFLKAYMKEDSVSVPESIKKAAACKFVECVAVEELLWLQSRLPENVHFYKIMENCDIILPRLKVEPRNSELEARIQKLKLLEEERKYKAMTKNVDSVRVRHPEDSIAYQVKEMNRQLIGVMQILVSISTGFAFGFIGMEWLIGPLDSGFRLLLGILFAAAIGIAEIYFFVKKLAEPVSFSTNVAFTKKKE